MGQKIQRFLARAGIGSRRACEELVAQGRVTVNGVPAHVGQRVDPERDTVRVDRRVVKTPGGPKTYIALNKPPGYLTSLRDPQGRKTVAELLGKLPARVFPVGRLDFDAMGLVLMTDDGELAYRLMHPSFEVRKRYIVEVDGPPDDEKMRTMLQGVRIGRRKVRVDRVRFLPPGGGRKGEGVTRVLVEVHEGQRHVVKNICRAVGYEPLKLIRVAIGPVELGRLAPGKWRRLTRREVLALKRAVGLEGEERDGESYKKRREKDSGNDGRC